MATRVKAPSPQRLSIADFSGGPNIRDAQTELAVNEQPDDWNVTFDERGGVSARLGYVKVNNAAYGGGLVKNVWYSTTVDDYVTQAGAVLYLGTGTTARKTFTTAARVGFADFAGKLCVIHPVDGLWTSTDGITYTAVGDVDAPKGDCLYVFQNKLWSNVTASPRIQWSNAADPTAWTATDFIDIREKDDEPIVALAGSSGVDVALGRVGLLAFKNRSAYRIYDSASGAYLTIDQRVGAASAVACAVSQGRVYTVSEYGVHWTDGVSPMTPASELLEPLWQQSQVALDQVALWCAGVRRERIYFSVCRADSAANDLAIEVHPEQGWVAIGSNAMSAYANYAAQTDKLYGGSPTVTGQVYELYTGGTDDGAPITTRFQTRWFEPADGDQFTVWRVSFRGKGSPHVGVRVDYGDTNAAVYDLSLSDTGVNRYDTGLVYDTDLVYTEPPASSTESVYPTVFGRSVSFAFTATTDSVTALPQILGKGSGPDAGGWRLYGIDVDYVPQTYA